MKSSIEQLAAELRPFIERCKAAGLIRFAPPVLIGNLTKFRAMNRLAGLNSRGQPRAQRTAGMKPEQRAEFWKNYRRNWRTRRAEKRRQCAADVSSADQT